ncbi:hypothetical protein B0H14DRAFT_2335014 [Mycena olivaceomarginata]|nr:hypothetical protein B0H14DRAFT_2335014 [Mycena olivaceomarginata]
MPGLAARHAGWLNDFVNWGRPATYKSSLWRIPPEFQWNLKVLKLGYLIVDEVAEFRMRFMVIANPGIQFPWHLLESAMEHGISFTIAFTNTDADRFHLQEDDPASCSVTKALVDLNIWGPRLNPSPSMVDVVQQYRSNIGVVGLRSQSGCIIARGGGASWILRAYLGIGHIASFMEGPSSQVSVHRCGARDSGDTDSLGLLWEAISEGDYLTFFGYITGQSQEEDTYLYPTDQILEEYSDHYYGEWNTFCDITFARLKKELESIRAKRQRRTKGEWKQYFQSSNRGKFAPQRKVTRFFIEEGRDRLEHMFGGSWNKRKIYEIWLPKSFRSDF